MKYKLRRVEVDGGGIETWLPPPDGTEEERQAAREWVKLCPEALPMMQDTLVLYHALLAMRERQLRVVLEENEQLEAQIARTDSVSYGGIERKTILPKVERMPSAAMRFLDPIVPKPGSGPESEAPSR